MNFIAFFHLWRRWLWPCVVSSWMTVATCAAPSPIPQEGLLLWLQADAGIQTKEGTVIAWQDSSAAGLHAERDIEFSTRAENPKLVRDVANGHAVLRFDGSDAAFKFSRLTNIQTVFWVVAKDSNSFGQNNERFVLGESTGKHFHVGTHKTAFILNTGEASPALRKGAVRVNGNIVDPVKANFPDRLAVISMVATGYVSADQISKDREFKGRSWQGDIAEIILYSRALGDAEREQVEKTLLEKYKVDAGADAPVAPAAVKKTAAWWGRWRGPAGDGLSDAKRVPTEWAADKHVAWSVDLPGLGNSSPSVWADKILLTSTLGGKTTVTDSLVFCIDRSTGKLLWKSSVPILSRPAKPPSENNGWATPTPATDGRRVVVVFATGTMACLGLDGTLLWTHDLGPLDHFWGLASSPVIEGSEVFYSLDQGKRSKQPSYMVAINLDSGHERWRKQIVASGERGYSTPLLLGENPRQLLLWSGNKLSAFDSATGASRWDVDVFSLGEPITTPILTRGNRVHISQSDNAMAFEVGATGAKQLWALDQKAGARIARIANSVIYENRLYCVSDSKQISCYETDMGKEIWSAEIDDAFYAAPVAAAGYVIFTGRSGKFYVIKAGDKYELAATNNLGWPCDASPAVADESLYFRTKRGAAATTLWCVTL